MKELKLSISDELYEELSDVEDRASFVKALIENKLERSESNISGSDEDVEMSSDTKTDMNAGTGTDILSEAKTDECEVIVAKDTPEDTPEDKVTTISDGLDIIPIKEDVAKPVDDSVIASLDEQIVESATSCCDAQEDVEDSEKYIPIEKMECFQRTIADLADRIYELEDKVRDMNIMIFTLKERSGLHEYGSINTDATKMDEPTSVATNDSIMPLPYETLSFPELKVSSELLPDDDPTNDSLSLSDKLSLISDDDPLKNDNSETSASLDDIFAPSNSTEVSSVEQSPLTSEVPKSLDVPSLASSSLPPSSDSISSSLPTSTPNTSESVPMKQAPDGSLPVIDRLECCIFTYLPFGSEVKKDVIKNLLAKRYTDNDLEAKINQLLASGEVSNIVDDGIVYLTRTSKKEENK